MMDEYISPPRARKDDLLVEELGEEILLYDRDSHTAHCLSPIAACIWRHCDGEHDATELAELAGASQSLVADALHELREKSLLDAEPALTQSTILGISRREAIGRVTRYGAAAATGSLIISATAATPAMASSGEEAFSCCQCKESTGGAVCDCTTWVDQTNCTSYCTGTGFCKVGVGSGANGKCNMAAKPRKCE